MVLDALHFFTKLKKKHDAIITISFVRMTRKEKTQRKEIAASIDMKARNK